MPKLQSEASSKRRPAGEDGKAPPLYQLMYYSESLVSSLDRGGRKQIDDILRVAIERNARSDVTGALAFNQHHFAQVLEGSHDVVKAAFDSIAKDSRHTKIMVLQEGWVEARDFAQWAMAYVEDEASVKVISPSQRLQDILAKERQKAAMALVEMMKFWLLRGQ